MSSSQSSAAKQHQRYSFQLPNAYLGAPEAALAILLIVNLGSMAAMAAKIPFWFDELLVLHLSRLPTFDQVLKALSEQADGMTPTWYYMIYGAARLPGAPELTLRLPSFIGHGLAIIGIYFFLRRPFPTHIAASVAALLAVSPLRTYAIEARPYSLLTGSLAMAAACWRNIGESFIATIGFSIFLAIAVASHHLAPLAIGCFVAAEITNWMQTKKHRVTFWLALLPCAAPLSINLPYLLSYNKSFSQFFWAKASVSKLHSAYMVYLGFNSIWSLTIVLLAIVIGIQLVRSRLRQGGSGIAMRHHALSAAETSLALSFIAYPAILCFLAMYKNSGFVDRYGWPAILGFSILLAEPLSRVLGKAWRILFIPAFVFSLAQPPRIDHLIGQRGPGEVRLETHFYSQVNQLEKYKELPIAAPSCLLFLVENNYLPPEWKQRIRYLADPKLSSELVNTDTSDRTLLLLARFAPLPVEIASSFLEKHSQFLLHADRTRKDWLLLHLTSSGRYKLTLLASDERDDMYLVDRQ